MEDEEEIESEFSYLFIVSVFVLFGIGFLVGHYGVIVFATGNILW